MRQGLDVLSQDYNWHYEGPRGKGGHNLRRPSVGTRVNLPADRNYATTWVQQDKMTGDHLWTNNVAKGIHHRGTRYSSWQPLAYEVIDFDHYNKGGMYQQYFKNTGAGKIKSLDDIHKAEEWIAGGAASGRRHRNELAELQAQLDRERLQREEIQRQQEAAKPKYVNLQGTQVAVGGINDYVRNMQNQWQTQSNQRFDAMNALWQQTNQANQARFDDRINMLDQTWQSKLASEQNVYQSRLADLHGQIGEYETADKQRAENQMREAERARIAASYHDSRAGSNVVQGVHSGKALTDPTWRMRSGGASSHFGRGANLTNRSLNI